MHSSRCKNCLSKHSSEIKLVYLTALPKIGYYNLLVFDIILSIADPQSQNCYLHNFFIVTYIEVYLHVANSTSSQKPVMRKQVSAVWLVKGTAREGGHLLSEVDSGKQRQAWRSRNTDFSKQVNSQK